MKLTRKVIDIIAPNHNTKNCSEYNTTNGNYELEEKSFQRVIVERSLRFGPECIRCFLLNHQDDDTKDIEKDEKIRIIVDVSIVPVQPKVKIIECD